MPFSVCRKGMVVIGDEGSKSTHLLVNAASKGSFDCSLSKKIIPNQVWESLLQSGGKH